jgi:hypothetical protein
MADVVQEGLGVPGSASSPLPPLDALMADELAVQEADIAVAADVAVLAAEGVASSALTSATSALSSAQAAESADTAVLIMTVETT